MCDLGFHAFFFFFLISLLYFLTNFVYLSLSLYPFLSLSSFLFLILLLTHTLQHFITSKQKQETTSLFIMT